MKKICSIIQGHDSQSISFPKPLKTGAPTNKSCVLCEFIMHLAQTFITANTSSKELVHILELVCQQMPNVLKDECKQFVDAYGPDIIALISRDFDPQKVCELIKVCPKSKNIAFLITPNKNICGLCNYVSTYLSNGYSIKDVCEHFSNDNGLKEKCETLVHIYKPNYCAQLPICSENTAIQSSQQSIGTTVKTAECALCKYIMSYVTAVIQNNKSEAAIQSALEKVCNILPGSLKSQCDQFVDSYTPVLYQILHTYVTPDDICAALKLCNNGTQLVSHCKYIHTKIDFTIHIYLL